MNAPAGRPHVYRFGVFELDTLAHELRKQGARIRLQEQPYQVLLMLLGSAGKVVTREELRQALWPSSVYVDFDHGLNNAIARLREALGDAATTPSFIETVPRLGYRFIYPVAPSVATMAVQHVTNGSPPVQDAQPAVPASADSALDSGHDEIRPVEIRREAASRWPIRRAIPTAMAIIALLALVAVFWPAQRSADEVVTATALPAGPSLAVLPFVNMSPDKENEYFADGLSDELASKLAGIKGLNVASLTASFRFKGKHESPAVIAKELKVNHLLEGSVRHSGNRVRINAQLIDARDGYHRWSETFDRELTDIFEIQEEIAIAVANALQVKLVAADTQRLRGPGTRDPEALRSYRNARGIFSWLDGKGDLREMKRLYEEAIKRDDKFAAAHAGLAHYYFNNEGEEGKRLGREAAKQAIALDPELSEAVSARACFELLRYQQHGDFRAYERAKSDFRRALEIDPANSQALFHYGRAVFWPEPAEALALFERNSAVDPLRFGAVGFSADMMSRLGRREAARERVMALYEQNPEQRSNIAIHVATLEYFEGHLARAVSFLERSRGPASMNRWPLYMSLGDREAASKLLARFTPDDPLGEAARLAMEGRHEDAFASLDRRLEDFPITRLLDVPAARMALLAAKPERARKILEDRLPDLVKGIESVNAYNVLPALDLAAAWAATGEATKSGALLDRAAKFLDGADASHWPMFIFLRARAHALTGERELALRTLDRAFDAGFRMTWGVDLFFQYFGYIDPVEADPAFAKLRSDPGFERWLGRIEEDNERQLARLRARDAQEQSAHSAAQ